MTKLLLVILGGSIGAACRYGVSLLAARLVGAAFPLGTLVVNLVGCLLIGLSVGLAGRLTWWSDNVRILFVTGFLGALTTFSSFAVETVNAAGTGSYSVAIVNFLANNIGGLALVLVGIWVAKAL